MVTFGILGHLKHCVSGAARYVEGKPPNSGGVTRPTVSTVFARAGRSRPWRSFPKHWRALHAKYPGVNVKLNVDHSSALRHRLTEERPA